MSWRDQGNCNSADPELFFPIGENAQARAQAKTAKAVCASCPVKAECLEWVLGHYPQAGVWAGLDETERENLRRKGQRAAKRYQRPKPEIQERREKVALWHSRGQSPAQIAEVLGVTPDIVSADLQRIEAA